MTEIDVPDWVVKAADEAGDEFAKTHTMSMYASLADMQRDCVRHMLTAALGAWVVPVGKLPDHALQRLSTIKGPGWDDLFTLESEVPDTHTLYTLRQEKPE